MTCNPSTETPMFRRVGGGTHVLFRLDGVAVRAVAGQTVAAALLGLGESWFRHAPDGAGPRCAYCLGGVCFECVMEIDGRRRQACLVEVVDGMDVVRRPA